MVVPVLAGRFRHRCVSHLHCWQAQMCEMADIVYDPPHTSLTHTSPTLGTTGGRTESTGEGEITPTSSASV